MRYMLILLVLLGCSTSTEPDPDCKDPYEANGDYYVTWISDGPDGPGATGILSIRRAGVNTILIGRWEEYVRINGKWSQNLKMDGCLEDFILTKDSFIGTKDTLHCVAY